jgi:mannose-6-phosphate isomerase-like protein (cupin superfamily)
MELKRYTDAGGYEFGALPVKELNPDVFTSASLAEITVPIGADRPRRVNQKKDRVYVCLAGEIEFAVDDETLHLTVGDVLHIAEGEEYGFHNGGYETGKLLLIRVPGPSTPDMT